MSITAANQQHRDAAPACTRRLRAMKTAAVALLAVGLAGLAVTPAWAAAPANDNFANAQAQTGSFTDSLSNTEATIEVGEPLTPSCTADITHTVWYGRRHPGLG